MSKPVSKKRIFTGMLRARLIINSGFAPLTNPIVKDLKKMGWKKVGEYRTAKSTYLEYTVRVKL